MQDVASDNGIGPISAPLQGNADRVGGLVAAVESKMSELVAWHNQQIKQLEADKTVLRTQAQEQAHSIEQERSEISWLRGEMDAEKARFSEEKAGLDRWRDDLGKQREGLKRWQAELEGKAAELDQGFTQLDQMRANIREQIEALLKSSIDQLGQTMKLVA